MRGWIVTDRQCQVFAEGGNSTHHKPLDHEKAGLVVSVSEAVLAGDLSRVTQVHLNTLMHSQLHLGPC